MGQSGDREVVYVMKGVVDPSAIESVRKLAQQYKVSQEEINKVEEGTVVRRKRRLDDEDIAYRRSKQNQLQVAREQGQAIERFYDEEDRRAAYRNKKATHDYDSSQKAMSDSLRRNIQQRMREQEKETAHAETLMRRAAERIQRTNSTIISSSRVLLRGFASIGFGFGELGLVAEEAGNKIVRKLLQIHAAYNLIRGSISLLQGVTQMWHSYVKAVEAAAAAHAALAAAQSRSAVAGAASGVAGAAGGVAAGAGTAMAPSMMGAIIPLAATGAMAAGSVAFAGKMTWDTIQAMRGNLPSEDSLYGRVSASNLNPFSWAADVGQGLMQHVLPGGLGTGPYSKNVHGGGSEWSAKYNALQAEAKTARMERAIIHRIDTEQGIREVRDRETQNITQRFAFQDQYKPLTSGIARSRFEWAKGGAGGADANVDQLKLRTGQQYIEILKQERKIQDQTDKDKLAKLQLYYEGLQKVHDQYVKNAEALQKGELSALSRLALSGPAEQMRIAKAMMDVRGGTASRSQAQAALEYMSPKEREQSERWVVQRFMDPRVRAVVGAGWEQESSAQTHMADITARQMADQANLIQKFSMEARNNASRFAAQLEQIIGEVIKIEFQTLSDELNKWYTDRAAAALRNRVGHQ